MLLPGQLRKGTAAPKKAQQKQSGVHQPRDADDTSGQNVQRSGYGNFDRMSKSRQKHLTAGRQKAGRESSTGSRVLLGRVTKCLKMRMPEVRRKVILQRKTVPLRRTMAQRRKKGSPAMTTATGTPIIRQRKGHYRRRKQREHTDRERTKTSDFEQDFNTKDNAFTEGEKRSFRAAKAG